MVRNGIVVHCAMTSRRGKTLAFDKEAADFKRLSTEDYSYGVNGILVASYRIAFWPPREWLPSNRSTMGSAAASR